MPDSNQLQELLLQALEHERGGVKVYETALKAVVNEELRSEWAEYLAQTHKHVQILEDVLQKLEIDPERETPGRQLVRSLGRSLVETMATARQVGTPVAAELVACDCVVIAETKDHANWELLARCAARLTGEQQQALRSACEIVEDEEDEHLYHSAGWARELWLESLGLEAELPPPEEREHVTTAIEAAHARQDSERTRLEN